MPDLTQSALSYVAGSFFGALQAVFKPKRSVKRHLRGGELVVPGQDRHRGTRRRHFDRLGRLDVEAGGGYRRVVEEECVHSMHQEGSKYEDEAYDIDDLAARVVGCPLVDKEDGQGDDTGIRAEDGEPRACTSFDDLPEELGVIIKESQAEKHTLYTDMWEDSLLKYKLKYERRALLLKAEERLSTSFEETCQIFVKEAILHSSSEYELLQRAELLIDADWLLTVDELPGNIYIMAAFGEFQRGALAGSWFDAATLKARVRMMGFFTIFFIQLVGPPLIFLSVLPESIAMGIERDQSGWRWDKLSRGRWREDLGKEWREQSTTKLLGILFLFAFILNASYVAYGESNTFVKLYDLFLYLNRSTPRFNLKGNWWLFIGACVNCWVVLWCSIDAAFIIGSGETPLDILLDALGIIFLYNLDDVGGDFAFVDEDDWPGLRLGWISAEMVGEVAGEEYQLRNKSEKRIAAYQETTLDKQMKFVGVSVYKYTIVITGIYSIVLPIANAFLPISLIRPDG